VGYKYGMGARHRPYAEETAFMIRCQVVVRAMLRTSQTCVGLIVREWGEGAYIVRPEQNRT